MKKILLALQFWAGDKNQAARLADFIADLESTHCECADFLFAARFDCPLDLELVKRVSRKFNVHTYTSRRRGKGWPQGCTELWLSTMEWCYSMKRGKRIPDYSAVFMMEADCVPISRGWVQHFHDHWEKEQARLNGKLSVMGVWLPNGVRENIGHINGACLCSLEMKMAAEIIRIGNRCPVNLGWDYYAGPQFKALGWSEMPGFVFDWRSEKVTEEKFRDLISKGTVFHHGCKDRSLFDLSRKNLL